MGWLDNSTNNVILDAVLTDLGRQKISSISSTNNFRITKYALGDDEVNYSIIKKFGRTIGKEKIEKNTPVFEAFTNQNLAQKYKLFGTNIPTLYLPKLQLTSPTTTVNLSTLVGNGLTSANVVVNQVPQGGETILADELQDSSYDVYFPSLFLKVDTPGSSTQMSAQIGQTNSTGKANFPSSPVPNVGQSKLEFAVTVNVLSNAIYQVYGRQQGNFRVISTSIRVVGVNTGLSRDIPVEITG